MTTLYFKIKQKIGYSYVFKSISTYLSILLMKLNKYLLKTYPLISDCSRCEDCGRNVHDFIVPDWLWNVVYGNESGMLCYDCFCNRADEIFRFKWRMTLQEEWVSPLMLETIHAKTLMKEAKK